MFYDDYLQVTDHANTAMLHFFAPTIPELAVKSFMVSTGISGSTSKLATIRFTRL